MRSFSPPKSTPALPRALCFSFVRLSNVIVATDYAGLGVSHCSQPQNQLIIHHYLANPAAANDVICSIVAARSAFPPLGSKSVSIGHSQGGGAVWAIAQYNSKENIEVYLGGVAIILTTDIRSGNDARSEECVSQIPVSRCFTEEGLAAVNTYREVEGGCAVGMGLFLSLALEGTLLRDGWRDNEWVVKYNDLIMSEGKEIGGTLLVIHGERDPIIDFTLTEKAVHDIAMEYPDFELEFIRLPTTHDSAITGSQWLWMD
ncbi:uncharacterized protein EAE98_000568 [Botrytis deweyae]|uniref:AB hydrolase-1 domain-containing protein n=1 Tax=Botrytis deweyae TaxID=2478750 RepID=A0ABQ7J324_9HELO|nr:uncharacterized protein EAE98_000568 [Botrytis deweyae]KAF7940441.1 hypothetical protein EAE98_000568 [Botrytis deweyae]